MVVIFALQKQHLVTANMAAFLFYILIADMSVACAKDFILSHPASTSSLCLELAVCSIVNLIFPSFCDSYQRFCS